MNENVNHDGANNSTGINRTSRRERPMNKLLEATRNILAAVIFAVTATSTPKIFAATSEIVPLFISASHASQQGFARIINHSDQSGLVTVTATDDAGRSAEITFEMEARETRHFNSADLEDGNAAKGITAIGVGMGDWRLDVESDLRLEVLAYVRTLDGFLTSMHDRARKPGLWHLVPTFNPASNRN